MKASSGPQFPRQMPQKDEASARRRIVIGRRRRPCRCQPWMSSSCIAGWRRRSRRLLNLADGPLWMWPGRHCRPPAPQLRQGVVTLCYQSSHAPPRPDARARRTMRRSAGSWVMSALSGRIERPSKRNVRNARTAVDRRAVFMWRIEERAEFVSISRTSAYPACIREQFS